MPESIEKVFEGAEIIKALTELLMEGGRTYKEALGGAIKRYEEAQKIKNDLHNENSVYEIIEKWVLREHGQEIKDYEWKIMDGKFRGIKIKEAGI